MRINYRWVRHSIDGSDKKQQACQTYDALEFHGALEHEKVIARVSIPFLGNASSL
jgi:hypothetical protein